MMMMTKYKLMLYGIPSSRKHNICIQNNTTHKLFALSLGLSDFVTLISIALSLFQQQSFLLVNTTLNTLMRLLRSTLHHGLLCLLVWVHDLPPQFGFLLPSTALCGTPPKPVEDCLVGFPRATLPVNKVLVAKKDFNFNLGNVLKTLSASHFPIKTCCYMRTDKRETDRN